MLQRESGEQIDPATEEHVCKQEQGTNLLFGKPCKGGLDIAFRARLRDDQLLPQRLGGRLGVGRVRLGI